MASSRAPEVAVGQAPAFGRARSARRYARATWRLIRRKPLGMAGLLILLVVAFGALFAPVIAPYSYDQTRFTSRLLSPSWSHPFGTDNLGRDTFTRILYGARVSLGISAGAVVLAKSIATVIAITSGFYGGWLDKLGQRLVDIWIALPTLIILVTLIGMIGSSPGSLVAIIALANAPGSSRVIRSVVVSVREEPYVEAGRAIGANDARLMFRYILPNIAHIVIYSSTVTLGSVILIVASLGFLGYGVPPPHPDLGGMLSGDGLTFMRRQPWLAVWPGVTITLVVFAFNVFGDALRDLLDPRLRGS